MNRNLVLVAGALFAFLLVTSAAHQVHHLFDPASENNCIAFTLSKSCHLNTAPAIDLAVVQSFVQRVSSFVETWIPYLSPSPFSKRAPPLL